MRTPTGSRWPLSRRKEYLDWTESVVAGVRGFDPALEALYDEMLANGREVLNNIKEE